MPLLNSDEYGWPQLSTRLEDHGPQLPVGDAGACFRSTDLCLPADIRKDLINLKLTNTKKAGTASNQKSAAATAWAVLNAESNFRAADASWTGLACWPESQPLPRHTVCLTRLSSVS